MVWYLLRELVLLSPKNLARRHLASIMTKAKIGGLANLYRLRHSFVTLSILSGADVKSVSHAAGHSSVAFTQDTYQHVLPAMRKDAAEKIGRLLFGNSLPDSPSHVSGPCPRRLRSGEIANVDRRGNPIP
jgi:hypothetical protein